MPATRSRSRSPRRSSTFPYSKDKAGKLNSRELISITTESTQDNKVKAEHGGKYRSASSNKSDSAKPKTDSANDSKQTKRNFRKPSELPVSKSGNSGNRDINFRSKERKFSGRCRLFIGNLTNCDDTELKQMFEKYGEVAEVFVNNEKGFGLVRLDTRSNAEAAKQAVDGTYWNGRVLFVRFAKHVAALKVMSLGPLVTSELLHSAFSQFGDVERAVVVCDGRGRSKGYGIVEFSRRNSAQTALQQINEGLFLLGRTPRPISVKLLEHEDDEDGVVDENVKRDADFDKEREVAPHFVTPNTFEASLAQRWRALEETEEFQKETLDVQFKKAREKLETEIDQAMRDHQSVVLLSHEIDCRLEEVLKREEMIKQEEMRRQEEMLRQEEFFQREEELRQKMFRQQQQKLQRHIEESMRQIATSYSGGFPPKEPPGMGRGMDWVRTASGPPARSGPEMMPPREPLAMGGQAMGGPHGPGPRPWFENGRECSRERVVQDCLAARSCEPSSRECGDFKRFRYWACTSQKRYC